VLPLAPEISVVVPTRGRGASVAASIESILAGPAGSHPRFEIVVVDQSDDERTQRALAPYEADERLRIRHTPGERGVSRARNRGGREARGAILAFTDDDCRADKDWLVALDDAFRADPRVGIVFGNVVPVVFERKAGFVPGYERAGPATARRLGEKFRVGGLSANMAVRREVFLRLGGFDERLGAGAPLLSGAETDLAMRALAAGIWVHETPAPRVVHHGFRDWTEGRVLVRRYWYGTGAAFGKQLRARPAGTLALLLRMVPRRLLRRSPVAASLGVRAYRGLRWGAFARGLARGVSLRVTREEHFRA